ncbi:MAG: DUF1318 domain-containing protein [Verrucomicrobiales bacterium]|nr:DUF1318 domain-containing protein [Verrucomicrobiales bacterium]
MKFARPILLLLALCLGALPVLAADPPDPNPDQLKERMKANLPAIDKLKKAGRIGENNKAYLEAREELTEKEKALIKTENEDRKAIYQLLAKRAKTSLEAIQKARTKQIRERSAAGLWLQDDKDHWYKKTEDPA